MIVTRESSAAPHLPSRIGSYAGASAAGCHGAGCNRSRRSGAPPGLPLRAHGRAPADVEPAGEGPHGVVADAFAAGQRSRLLHRGRQPRTEECIPRHARDVECRVPQRGKSKWTESSDYYLGTTVDQLAAQQLGKETRLPSLELSMDLVSMVGQCDNGYACVYQNNLSWSSPTTPLPSEAHPRKVFERLVRRWRQLGRPVGGDAEERQPARLDAVGYRAPAAQARPGRPRQGE